MSRVTRTLVVDDDGLAALRRPRAGLALEVATAPDRFGADSGPFHRYERTLEVTPDGPDRWSVIESIRYQLAVRYWRALLAIPVRNRLRSEPAAGRQPWWAPADRFDPRAAEVLSILAVLAVIAGYLGTLIAQTMTFAAAEFGADDSAQGISFASIRIGAIIALGVLTVADRNGRRIVLVGAALFGILATAVGAASTGLPMLTVTQVVGRAFATSLIVLLPVVVAEEMPPRSRAYAVAAISVAGAFGAGIAVAALPLADLGDRGWRLIFLVPLLGLPAVVSVARHLPESHRFELHRHDDTGARDLVGHRGRLALLATTGFLVNVMVAPASQFRNELLTDVHGFNATSISAFVLLTSAPAGVGAMFGGKLADRRGRRVIAGLGMALSALMTAAFFLSSGIWLWGLALSGTVVGAVAGPAVKVYEPELFPTRLRSRATGLITAVTLLGSIVGLLLAGFLSDAFGRLGPAVAITATGPLIAAVVILARYPETAGVELEELNPGDATGGSDQE